MVGEAPLGGSPAGSLDSLLERGASLQRDGRLDEASAAYSEIQSRWPDNFDAMHLLGVIALQRGDLDAAQDLIQRALTRNPDDVAALGNLGTSYLRAGRLEPALRWFERALQLQPDSSIAITNAASALHNLGRYGDAIPLLRRAYLADPNSLTVCNLLGGCLIKHGEVREAVEIFDKATQVQPDNAEGWANLSVALNAIGETSRARECADTAVSLGPDSPTALGALAAAQFDQGRLADAVDSYRRAVQVKNPSPQLLAAYANALLACGLQDEAVVQLQRAARTDEKNLVIRWATVIAQLKAICKTGAEVTESRVNFSRAMDEVKTWYQDTVAIHEPFGAVGVCQPFYLAYQPFNNRELLTRYGELCATWMATLPAIPAEATTDRPRIPTGSSPAGRRLRIGFASAHISDHSVWNAITKGWVNHIDRARFEIHLFQLKNTADLQTDAARSMATHFVDEPTTLTAWVQAIKDSELDVLVYPEIGMDPMTLQLAALRLAPLQAATWGHPETTGLPTMDLYISADALEPANATENYREKLVKLPHLGVYVEPLAPAIMPVRRGSLNLPRGEPLLLCPGAPFKYSPLHDDVWVAIASQLKKKFLRWRSGGRLVFFRSRSPTMDQILENRLRAAFAKAAVEFDTHVSLIPNLDRSRFFGLMRQSALLLDTIGFSGFNTALQAIECDLPVLAFEGEFMRGRLASAIMRKLELPELVATTQEDFVHKAVELAGDPHRLGQLRRLIIERRHGLFHDLSTVRALETHLTAAVAGLACNFPDRAAAQS